MANKDREFHKYLTRGAYHWEQISMNVKKRNAFVIARYKNCIRLINEKARPGSTILDAGCGDGVFSYLISREGHKVSGVDLSPEAIDAGTKITKSKGQDINFQVGSVYEMPFPDNHFDVAVSTEVIEHLENVDQFISELKRVTKPGGTIIVTTPIRITKNPLDPEHVIEWFEGDYQELMKGYFDDISFKSSHPVLYMDLYQARWFGQLLGRLKINLLSFVWNPFAGFSDRYKYQAIQYAIAKNK